MNIEKTIITENHGSPHMWTVSKKYNYGKANLDLCIGSRLCLYKKEQKPMRAMWSKIITETNFVQNPRVIKESCHIGHRFVYKGRFKGLKKHMKGI